MDGFGTLPRRRRRNTMDKIKSAILQTYHKDSYMAHRRDWRLGHEGRYRRTLSPCRPLENDDQPTQAATVSRSASCATPSRSSAALAAGTLKLRQPASDGKSARKDDRRPASAVFSSDLRPVGEWDCSMSTITSISSEREPLSNNGDGDSSSSRLSKGKRETSIKRLDELSKSPVVDALQVIEDEQEEVAGRLDANGNVEKTSVPDSGSQATYQQNGNHSEVRTDSGSRTDTTGDTSLSAATSGCNSSSTDNQKPVESSPKSSESVDEVHENAMRPPEDYAPSNGLSSSQSPIHPKVNGNSTGSESSTSARNDADGEHSSSLLVSATDNTTVSEATTCPPPAPVPRRKNATTSSIQPPSVTVSPSAPSGRVSLPAFQTLPTRLNGVLRLDRTHPRPTARDLLDPRRLPEAMERAEQLWDGMLSSAYVRTDSAGSRVLPERRWSALCVPSEPRLGGRTSPGRTASPTSLTRPGSGRWSPQPVSPLSGPGAAGTPPAVDRGSVPGGNDTPSPYLSSGERQLKQAELASRLSEQLCQLREEQRALEEQIATNAALGTAVTSRVVQLLRPSEAERYRVSIEQVGVITSLMLCLEGRLERIQAALDQTPNPTQDQQVQLTRRREKVSAQLEEARLLEEGVSRRRRQVDACLERYLSTDELHSYQSFVSNKARLIRQSREVENRVRTAEERLAALQYSDSPA